MHLVASLCVTTCFIYIQRQEEEEEEQSLEVLHTTFVAHYINGVDGSLIAIQTTWRNRFVKDPISRCCCPPASFSMFYDYDDYYIHKYKYTTHFFGWEVKGNDKREHREYGADTRRR